MEVTNAYKIATEGKVTGTALVGARIGHSFPFIAQISGSYNACYGSIFPLCGPLIFINQNKQLWTTGCMITYKYKKATFSEYESKRFIDKQYYRKNFVSGVTVYTDTVYIETGTREYSQFYGNTDYVYEVTELTGSDPTQEINVYCMADDGARLLNNMEDETTRNMLDIIQRGLFVHPPLCKLCNGVGTYNGTICTECRGYKYKGWNAEKYLLTQRGKDVGVFRQTDSEESFQYRTWAKKWHITPTKNEVKRYIAHMIRTDTGMIDIEEHYLPECYWILRYPAIIALENGIGDILSIYGTTLQNIVSYCEPAGTRGLLEEYYYMVSDYGVWDYCHNIESGIAIHRGINNPPHTAEKQDLFGWFFFDTDSSFNNHNFGSEWSQSGGSMAEGTKFFYEDKYILNGSTFNTGIIYIAGTGYWSGITEMLSTPDITYWSGEEYTMSNFDYERIMLHDSPFTTSGTWIVS
jgi:hypothetical protein